MNHRNGLARPRSRSRILVVCLLMSLLPAVGLAAPGAPAHREAVLAADRDGDGIADEFDPDDDNDGLADDREGSAGNPGPDILDPGKDTDDDGISNVLDPDDNNNGVTDEEDPTSFPPTGGGSSNPSGSSQEPSTDSGQPSAGAGGQDDSGLTVRALPVTGTAPSSSPWVIPALLAILCGVLGAASSRKTIPAPQR